MWLSRREEKRRKRGTRGPLKGSQGTSFALSIYLSKQCLWKLTLLYSVSATKRLGTKEHSKHASSLKELVFRQPCFVSLVSTDCALDRTFTNWLEQLEKVLVISHCFYYSAAFNQRNWRTQQINSSRSEVYKFDAWGSRQGCLGRSNLDLPIFFSKVSAQLPSNKTKSRPLTVAYSHVSSFLACFAANICVLTCLFIVCEQVTEPISDANEGPSKDSNPWFNKWLEIHSGGDLQLFRTLWSGLLFMS